MVRILVKQMFVVLTHSHISFTVPNTEANRDHLSLPSLSFSPSMSNSKFNQPQADKTTIEAVNGVDAYTNDIFDFGSPIHPLEDSFAIRPQTTQALRIRTRMSTNTLFQHGRPDRPLRRKSKSWSMSPMDLATPSPPPSPPKIVGDNFLASTDTPLVINEPKRDSSCKLDLLPEFNPVHSLHNR